MNRLYKIIDDFNDPYFDGLFGNTQEKEPKQEKNIYKVINTDKNAAIVCEVAGLKKEDIKIIASDDSTGVTYLKIEGKTEDEIVEGLIHNVEAYVEVDKQELDLQNAKSVLKNGILYIDIPKREKIESKNIEIEIK